MRDKRAVSQKGMAARVTLLVIALVATAVMLTLFFTRVDHSRYSTYAFAAVFFSGFMCANVATNLAYWFGDE